ncbi:MAG: PAC2 family protein [Dehalococcoidia bacterium]|nr:MAG: PAC2 family protein [Dehalococcoidia bacterium]
MESIKFYREPELDNPCLVTAWPGVGNVAVIAVTYLRDKLNAEELGEIDPAGFFDLGGVFIKDNLVETPEFPKGKFFYRDSGGEGKDIIIFLAEAQPATGSYEYAGLVLDVAQRFGVKRVYSLAAALTEYHPDRPRVLGAASSPELLEELTKLDVVMAGDFFVAGLNGLLLGVAAERGMEAICLLGETVKYAAKMANPSASQAVLRVLTSLLGVEIDMAELEEFAKNSEKQIREIGNEMKREFLQNFTKPIWERQENEENG